MIWFFLCPHCLFRLLFLFVLVFNFDIRNVCILMDILVATHIYDGHPGSYSYLCEDSKKNFFFWWGEECPGD